MQRKFKLQKVKGASPNNRNWVISWTTDAPVIQWFESFELAHYWLIRQTTILHTRSDLKQKWSALELLIESK